MKKESLLANPFEEDIVSEPRRVKKAVSGLNEKPLEELICQFEYLENTPLPRSVKLSHAQFVVSPQPGYGKSHLIGRLFRKLNQRATLVYLRPFEDASTYWKSVLLKMVQELDFPDNVDVEYGNSNYPTQLEALAHGILTHLVADTMACGKIRSKDKDATIKWLRSGTVQKTDQNWYKWILNNFRKIKQELARQLQSRIRLKGSAQSWLGVLFTYAYFPTEFELRETCLDWLKGGSIDANEAKKIGIRASDIPYAEMSVDALNELCKQRILDFCQLAGFFRPFVFCFDQTENYGKEIILSKSFGLVIQVLSDEAENQMTVVTANQHAWTQSIRPWWEEAHRNRLGTPLELEGLNRQQAEELIQQRLEGWNIENDNFYDSAWLDELFPGGNELGVRDFIKKCNHRWQVIMGQSPKQITIETCYQKSVKAITFQPKRLLFDPNTLYWLVYEASTKLPGLTIEKYKSQKGYFTLLWKLTGRQIFFGFESGSNWSRWRAIKREAERYYEHDHTHKAVLFRTPDLPEIPKPTWTTIAQEIKDAEQKFLNIIHLNRDETIRLYAAHELYIDAGEGDIPFQRHEVLDFIRDELKPFWDQIQQFPPEQENEESEPVAIQTEGEKNSGGVVIKFQTELKKEIRNIVQQEKFMSMDDLIKKLSQSASEGQIRKASGEIPEIKVHNGPNNMTVLRWQSNQST